ncbi:hypothetical protein [Caulobacter vibrioides]|uniref:MA superfamily peptidase n=1 Tax=Caulobacter vibrioides (strain NA1000 / CB15N) TaxID=565050 RepID=A0A0H3C6I6_CAUVN|nr:hypothetical protein [Caulobacter vibrioides]YP_002516495.1 MA superfamily peptidase [Caulobacter vibrioides NA1000]ACL94587.1 MA superfamily peptidase [Caulobacter vibrioides NA1000]QXZ53148.1 hypothetical protein KZH45_05610 [Caulobacter vibrioides]
MMVEALSRRRVLYGVAAPLLAFAGPAWAQSGGSWLHVTTPSFDIHGRVDAKTLLRLAREVEDFDGLLRTLHDVNDHAPARPLSLYISPNDADMRRVRPDGPRVTGFYSAGVGEVFAVLSVDGGEDRGRQVLFHEYAHHFMLRNAPAAYPAWLVEGYAEYFATVRFTDDSIELGVTSPRIARLRGAVWSPFEDILGRRALTGTQNDIAAFYAQSWLLTHYMMSDPTRLAALQRYASAVAEGGDPVALMPGAVGVPLDSLERLLKRYMGALPGRRLPRPPSAAIEGLQITRLPASADALILENQRLKMGVPTAERAAFLTQIRERAARFPGDRLAELTLARAENDFGDRSKAQALLRGRIAADPTDVEALQILGWSCMLQARAEPASAARWLEEARDHLGAAFKLDPDNPLVLYDYALTRRGEPAYPSENILNVLLKAQAIAPQVSAFRMGAVDGLVRRDRFEEAAVLLQPLLNNPHASREQVQAWRQQFDEIVARRKPAASSGAGDKDASDG